VPTCDDSLYPCILLLAVMSNSLY